MQSFSKLLVRQKLWSTEAEDVSPIEGVALEHARARSIFLGSGKPAYSAP